MEASNEIKNLISEAKNICLIPNEDEPESLTSALALFYTLKPMGKNVNLIANNFPENINFLIPSADSISLPKNFVISIPKRMADISQVYYEKNEENLKIHLTIDNGQINKEDLSFYFSQPKPDLIITLGIKDFHAKLKTDLESFGFLLGSTIVNIDNLPQFNLNNLENTKYGKINLIEQKSISEIVFNEIKALDPNPINQKSAECVLTGLVIFYNNFQDLKTSSNCFELASILIKRGAEYNQIVDNLYKTTEKEILFLTSILNNLKNQNGKDVKVAVINSDDFKYFNESQASTTVRKIKTIGMQNNLIALWKSQNHEPSVRGFFYSKKANLINRFAEFKEGKINNGWVFFQFLDSDIELAKEKIIKLL